MKLQEKQKLYLQEKDLTLLFLSFFPEKQILPIGVLSGSGGVLIIVGE